MLLSSPSMQLSAENGPPAMRNREACEDEQRTLFSNRSNFRKSKNSPHSRGGNPQRRARSSSAKGQRTTGLLGLSGFNGTERQGRSAFSINTRMHLLSGRHYQARHTSRTETVTSGDLRITDTGYSVMSQNQTGNGSVPPRQNTFEQTVGRARPFPGMRHARERKSRMWVRDHDSNIVETRATENGVARGRARHRIPGRNRNLESRSPDNARTTSRTSRVGARGSRAAVRRGHYAAVNLSHGGSHENIGGNGGDSYGNWKELMHKRDTMESTGRGEGSQRGSRRRRREDLKRIQMNMETESGHESISTDGGAFSDVDIAAPPSTLELFAMEELRRSNSYRGENVLHASLDQLDRMSLELEQTLSLHLAAQAENLPANSQVSTPVKDRSLEPPRGHRNLQADPAARNISMDLTAISNISSRESILTPPSSSVVTAAHESISDTDEMVASTERDSAFHMTPAVTTSDPRSFMSDVPSASWPENLTADETSDVDLAIVHSVAGTAAGLAAGFAAGGATRCVGDSTVASVNSSGTAAAAPDATAVESTVEEMEAATPTSDSQTVWGITHDIIPGRMWSLMEWLRAPWSERMLREHLSQGTSPFGLQMREGGFGRMSDGVQHGNEEIERSVLRADMNNNEGNIPVGRNTARFELEGDLFREHNQNGTEGVENLDKRCKHSDNLAPEPEENIDLGIENACQFYERTMNSMERLIEVGNMLLQGNSENECERNSREGEGSVGENLGEGGLNSGDDVSTPEVADDLREEAAANGGFCVDMTVEQFADLESADSSVSGLDSSPSSLIFSVFDGSDIEDLSEEPQFVGTVCVLQPEQSSEEVFPRPDSRMSVHNYNRAHTPVDEQIEVETTEEVVGSAPVLGMLPAGYRESDDTLFVPRGEEELPPEQLEEVLGTAQERQWSQIHHPLPHPLPMPEETPVGAQPFLISTASVLSSLECPICFAYMIKGMPILLCVNGHNVCGHCQRRVRTCPICRGRLLLTRNLALEAIATDLEFRLPSTSNHARGQILRQAETGNHVEILAQASAGACSNQDYNTPVADDLNDDANDSLDLL